VAEFWNPTGVLRSVALELGRLCIDTAVWRLDDPLVWAALQPLLIYRGQSQT
jgi:hypothetical protein